MNDRLKEVFDEIHAEEELKEKTMVVLARRIQEEQRKKGAFRYRRLVPVLLCCLFLLVGFGGYRLWFTPTLVISIDVNPSLELGINRFDRVVSMKGYNEEGKNLLSGLNIWFQEYSRALEQILSGEEMTQYLENDEEVTIVVVGDNGEQSKRVLSGVASCTEETENTCCYEADPEEVEQAHDVGMSYGKYRAFLELQALDPSVTPEEVQKMTMREIRERIAGLSGTDNTNGSGSGSTETSGEACSTQESHESHGGNGKKGEGQGYGNSGSHGENHGEARRGGRGYGRHS